MKEEEREGARPYILLLSNTLRANQTCFSVFLEDEDVKSCQISIVMHVKPPRTDSSIAYLPANYVLSSIGSVANVRLIIKHTTGR